MLKFASICAVGSSDDIAYMDSRLISSDSILQQVDEALDVALTCGGCSRLAADGRKEPAFNVVDLIVYEKSVVGYSLHAETDEEVSKALIKLGVLVAKGQLKPVIDSTVSIEDFERGYSRLASRKAVRSVVLRL